MNRYARIRALSLLLIALLAVLAVQGVMSDVATGGVTAESDGMYPGQTLITVQSYQWFYNNNGKAIIVNQDGHVLWEYDPPNTRVFDAEELKNGNILVTTAKAVPNDQCPPEFQNTDKKPGHCARNKIIEVDRQTKEVVWSYSWYDVYLLFHETHDADRLPNGETLIADMGNERVFTVNQSGAITWKWQAENHLGPGTEFWRQYVPDDAKAKYRRKGLESDWTHLNDVDRLPNGNIQVSIRNFDVVVEVDRASKDVVSVVGRPGNHSILKRQHNPHRLGETILIPDSENNRIVERDVDTGDAVWSFTGENTRLAWPRDADRLPNGNTLIADSRGFRVLEVNESGNVVWSYSFKRQEAIVYEADRLSVPEEPTNVPSGRTFSSTEDVAMAGLRGYAGTLVHSITTWAGFVFPPWIRGLELVTIIGILVVSGALVVDIALFAKNQLRSGA